jgi:DNA repair exonuclease SbcCD ATPase subunit
VRTRTARERLGHAVSAGGLVALLAVAADGALASGQDGLALGLGALALVVALTAAGLAYRWTTARAALASARATATHAAATLAEARAHAAAAARLGIDAAARDALAARFNQLGVAAPTSLAECQARLDALGEPSPAPVRSSGYAAPDQGAAGGTLGDSPTSIGAVERALGEAAAREASARAQAAERRAAVQAGLAALDVSVPAELSVAAVARELASVADDPAAATAVAERRDALLAELGALRTRQAALEREWGLAEVALDLAACEAEATALRRDHAVRARAVDVIALARDRLVQRVLPNTIRHVQLLLPLLTAGRYRDAAITDDYRIRVWDERAGRYVAKHLFSGGTRDQFSLALRLAFALATLPAERGARPGFLFLDEPLSAFDAPRARALVELLTTGYVAAHFAQVFVISHGGPFDRHAFPYALRLANGRVVESNLPSADAWGPPAAQPLPEWSASGSA